MIVTGDDRRVGIGFDVHALVPGLPLILGGVTVPFDKGLQGHSDADVLTHAIIDSLLGAAALGDIGTHFPDHGDEFKGIYSLELLRRVVTLLSENGWRVVNVDSTVVAQAPRLAPHIDAIRESLASCLLVPVQSVGVKASTSEGLGFTGRGEGIAAFAVCMLAR